MSPRWHTISGVIWYTGSHATPRIEVPIVRQVPQLRSQDPTRVRFVHLPRPRKRLCSRSRSQATSTSAATVKVFYDVPMTGRFPGNLVETITSQLVASPIDNVDIAAIHPSMFTLAEQLVAQIHDLDYIRSIVTGNPSDMAEGNGYIWFAGAYRQTIARTAGIVAATVDAVDRGLTGGTLSPGMHRARRTGGADGCTFNGMAAAALWVSLNRHDHNTVILDFSAAFSTGTSEIVAPMDRVSLVDLSTNNDDWDAPETEALRFRPPERYLDYVSAATDLTLSRHPDIVIANMSHDPDVHPATLTARDRFVAEAFRRSEVPVVFIVGQGSARLRTLADIAELHVKTIEAFANPRQTPT